MKPTTAIANGFYYRYGDFRGRSCRAEFWWCLGAFFLANALAAGIASALPSVGNLVVSAFALATVVPYAALLVRRLHDIGWSGRWVGAAFLLSLTASGLAVYEAFAWMPFVSAVAFLALFALCARRGQQEPNRYGPVPQDSSRA